MKKLFSVLMLIIVCINIVPYQAFATVSKSEHGGDLQSGQVNFISTKRGTVAGYFVAIKNSDKGYDIYPISQDGKVVTGENNKVTLSHNTARFQPNMKDSWAGKEGYVGTVENITNTLIRFIYDLSSKNKTDLAKWNINYTNGAGSVDGDVAVNTYLGNSEDKNVAVTLDGKSYKVEGLKWADIKDIDTVNNVDNRNEFKYLEWLSGVLPNKNTIFEDPKYKSGIAKKVDPLGEAEKEVNDTALSNLLKHKPGANSSEYEKAKWSGRYAYMCNKLKIKPTEQIDQYADIVKPEVYKDEAQPELKQAYVESLYKMWDDNFVPYSDFKGSLKKQIDTSMPIDAATATYALKQYNALSATGLATIEQRMYAYQFKLEATIGLASQVIVPSEKATTSSGITVKEANDFIAAAYDSDAADIRKLMTPDIDYPKSPHLGNDINKVYYFYLVQCYQEFAAYGTKLVSILSPVITEGNGTFAGYQEDLKAIQSLYNAAMWADDDSLWMYWGAINSNVTIDTKGFGSLKAIYDYLLSKDAFSTIKNYDPASVDSVFSYFFGTEGSTFQLSEDIKKGIIASATYLPMRTNVYDPYTYKDVVDTGWLLNFHSKFGYNRKALYIDTNVDSAVNYQRTGGKGKLRVCTLNDLMYADKDIVLYLDDNLYNVNKLADLTDKAFTRLDNVDKKSSTEGFFGKIWESVTGIFDVSMESIAKTAEVTTYSSKVMNTGFSGFLQPGDEFFMPRDVAKSYLSPDHIWDTDKDAPVQDDTNTASTYTPLTGFAELSGVYGDRELFNTLNTVLSKNTPVFISSPTMPYIPETDDKDRNQIFNYLILKNLNSQMSVDYSTNLDMTSPIYMDIYGNIVTESGLVVVPSAANATLWEGGYSPYNAALMATYGDDFTLKYDPADKQLNKTLSKVFTNVDGNWELTSVKVADGNIDVSKLSTADKSSLNALSDVFAYDLNSGAIVNKAQWEMILTEVIRGAPIEDIDKDFEGLNLSHRVTKNGLVLAEKLDFLVKALESKGENTTLAIPNPAYMSGIEYVVFFAFKILILLTLVVWMFMIYADAVGGTLNWRTGAKCVGVIVLVLSMIVGIPTAFEVSYYESNKLLLQSETEYIMMLNLEKSEAGQEIGITSVQEPEEDTVLYLKLADVYVPWYDLLPKIIASSSTKSLEQLYATYAGQHPIAGAKDVELMNDGAYISTEKLFDSSTISFSPTVRTLYQQTTGDTPASYYTPYYYFLDQIIYKANQYAMNNNYYAYTTKVQRGGKLKTLGYVQPYLTSKEFMEDGNDYFGLYSLYGVTPPRQYDQPDLDDATLKALRNSQWCDMNISDQGKIDRIQKLNEYARKWVAENRDMIGKVTDETFLKSMALDCAMEHNRLFNTEKADNLEIYKLSNQDLLRLSIASHDTVMKTSTMSYARFVYTVGGTPAVYAAALLELVNFVGAWVKPIVTLLVFLLTFVSIFVFKLLLRRGGNSIYGYVTTILLMCGVNVLGSLFLKLSMYIPNTGLTPTVCILIQVLVQCAYIYLLVYILKIAVKDWPNIGFQQHNRMFDILTHRAKYSVDAGMPKHKNGWDYYNILKNRQLRRGRRL